MYLDYSIFLKLYNKAKESCSAETFVKENQHEMICECDKEIVLKIIYEISRDTFKNVAMKFNLSRSQISSMYCIPYRTVQNWQIGERKPPEYVENLLYYVMLTKYINENFQ